MFLTVINDNCVTSFYYSLGLIVAVIDHEHFRMKLLYKQKKQVAQELKSCKIDNKGLQVGIQRYGLEFKECFIVLL